MSASGRKSSALTAITSAWLIVGVLDISSAFVIWWFRGVTWTRGLQGLASGLLGAKAFEGGFATAILGLALHFLIALVVVTIFYLASRKLRFLTEHAFVSGLLYGSGVYLVMYWIVLPTTFPTFQHRLSNDALAIAIHITLIGLPTALVIGRQSSLKFNEVN